MSVSALCPLSLDVHNELLRLLSVTTHSTWSRRQLVQGEPLSSDIATGPCVRDSTARSRSAAFDRTVAPTQSAADGFRLFCGSGLYRGHTRHREHSTVKVSCDLLPSAYNRYRSMIDKIYYDAEVTKSQNSSNLRKETGRGLSVSYVFLLCFGAVPHTTKSHSVHQDEADLGAVMLHPRTSDGGSCGCVCVLLRKHNKKT